MRIHLRLDRAGVLFACVLALLLCTSSIRAEEPVTRMLHLPVVSAGPAPRETRALWVSRFDLLPSSGLLTPADIQAIVDQAAYAHLNVVLFQVRGTADAAYRSSLEPWMARFTGTLGQDPGWDPLAEMIARGHAAGLQVHAWINAYPVWAGANEPPTATQPLPMFHDFSARYSDDWVQWHQTNGPMRLNASYLWANPAHPAVVQRIVDVAKDILAHYAVDGLHFDYIRYDDRPYSHDPLSNQAYAAALAAEPGLTRAEWQRRQVTGLLERVKQEALPLRPGARLTATAWPVYIDRWGWFNGYDGYSARYQDSQSWAHNGIVSAIMPMIYGPSFTGYADRFEILARDFVAGAQPGGAIMGITGDYASFTDLAWRIEVSRASGAWGQALFSYGALKTRDYWDDLRNGPYRRIAVPNWP